MWRPKFVLALGAVAAVALLITLGALLMSAGLERADKLSSMLSALFLMTAIGTVAALVFARGADRGRGKWVRFGSVLAVTLTLVGILAWFFLSEGLDAADKFGSVLGPLLLGLLGILGSTFLGLESARRRSGVGSTAEAEPSDFDTRITTLTSNLQQSSALIQELEAELALRAASLNAIKQEAEDNRRLAALHREEAEAVGRLVEAIQNKSTTRSRREQFMLFGAGLLASIPFGVLGNFIFSLLSKD